MRILFVRHGQTDWNTIRRVQGRTDIELNDLGKKQASVVREKLSGEKIDLIISSPLKRAMQTAQIINENRQIPITFDDRIIERSFGDFEGKIASDINANDLWNYNLIGSNKTIEPIKDFVARVFDFIDDLKNKYFDKTILIVAHGGVSIPFKCYFDGIPENGMLPFGIENCQVLKYEI